MATSFPITVLPDTVKLVDIVARPVCAKTPEVVGDIFVAYIEAAFATCNLSETNNRIAVFVEVSAAHVAPPALIRAVAFAT